MRSGRAPRPAFADQPTRLRLGEIFHNWLGLFGGCGRLIGVGDTRKGGSIGHFLVVWPRSGPCFPRWTAFGIKVERP
jgi:hypothetical protein